MSFFAKAFSEHSGKASSSRLLTAGAVVVILGCWAAVTLHRWELQPISPEQLGIILGALATKSWQRGRETGTQQANPGSHQ